MICLSSNFSRQLLQLPVVLLVQATQEQWQDHTLVQQYQQRPHQNPDDLNG